MVKIKANFLMKKIKPRDKPLSLPRISGDAPLKPEGVTRKRISGDVLSKPEGVTKKKKDDYLSVLKTMSEEQLQLIIRVAHLGGLIGDHYRRNSYHSEIHECYESQETFGLCQDQVNHFLIGSNEKMDSDSFLDDKQGAIACLVKNLENIDNSHGANGYLVLGCVTHYSNFDPCSNVILLFDWDTNKECYPLLQKLVRVCNQFIVGFNGSENTLTDTWVNLFLDKCSFHASRLYQNLKYEPNHLVYVPEESSECLILCPIKIKKDLDFIYEIVANSIKKEHIQTFFSQDKDEILKHFNEKSKESDPADKKKSKLLLFKELTTNRPTIFSWISAYCIQ